MWEKQHTDHKKGFTLIEVLGVVAIIVVALAIAIPSIIGIANSLKFKRMNEYAKTIFMAAQNNLIEMRSFGKLEQLLPDEDGRWPDGAGKVTEANNADFPAEDWSAQYCYTTAGAAFDLVLPVGSVEQVLRDQKILIEYNPYTGNVYSVFYSEGDQELSYETVTRDDALRKKQMLGYYQGSGLSGEALDMNPTVHTAEVDVNGQESILNVSVPIPDEYLSNPMVFLNSMRVSATVKGEQSEGMFTIDPSEFSTVLKTGNTAVASFCLDSLNDQASFASLAQNNPHNPDNPEPRTLTEITDTNPSEFVILPGDNLDITVEISFDGLALTYDPISVDGVSSLFSSMTTITQDGQKKYCLYLTNGRHLQNLNALHPDIAKNVAQVYFADNIYWNETVAYYNDKYGDGDGFSSNEKEAPARALPYFVPIANKHLFGVAHFEMREDIFSFITDIQTPVLTDSDETKHATIQGGGNGVYYLNIDATQYNIGKAYYAGSADFGLDRFTGLFAYLDTDVYGLSVVNPRVTGAGFQGENNPAVGALAGACGHQTYFYECSTYIDTDDKYFNWGQMGSYRVSGYGAVGGLVGYAKSHNTIQGVLQNNKRYLAFSNCFAAVSVSGVMRESWGADYGYSNGVGGLLGCSIITNFYNCYASGDVEGYYGYSSGSAKHARGVGGFVGTSHGTKYTNCFSTGNVNGYLSQSLFGGSFTGGFVGVARIDESFTYKSTTIKQNTVFTSCYSAGVSSQDGQEQETFCGYRTWLSNALDSLWDIIQGGITGELSRTVDYYLTYKVTGREPINTTAGEYNYLFKDSYYLNLDDNADQKNSNDCAEVVTFDALANLPAYQADRANDLYPKIWERKFEFIGIPVYDLTMSLPDDKKILDKFLTGFSTAAWENATAGTTHAYYAAGAAGAVYPFSKLKNMDYYGEWPAYPLNTGLAYYEVYDGDEWGFYLNSNRTSTLKDNKIVRSDGYALLSQSDTTITVKVANKSYSINPIQGKTVTMDNVAYYIYPLPWDAINADLPNSGTAADQFYLELKATVENKTYTMYFNPRFALTQINPVNSGSTGQVPNAVKPESLPGMISVRTWRQLCALGQNSQYWGKDYHYQQQLDINSATYTASTYYQEDTSSALTLQPIGSKETPFQGSYSGAGSDRSFSLTGFGLTDLREGTGLFGVIGQSGSVSYLNLNQPEAIDYSPARDLSASGVLAGENHGTVENIQMTLGNVSVKAENYAGAAVGLNTGTIRDCTLTANGVTVLAKEAGGFLGGSIQPDNQGTEEEEDSKTVSVNGCTVQLLTSLTYMPGSTAAGGFAGTLEGDVRNLSLTCPQIALPATQDDSTPEPAQRLGGLAGQMKNVTAKNLTVNIQTSLAGGQDTAGLAALAELSEFTDCTLRLSQVSGSGNTAGVFAQAKEISAANIQTDVNQVTSSGDAAGFAVSLSGTVENCPLRLTGVNAWISGKNAAGFVLTQTGTGSSISGSSFSGSGSVQARDVGQAAGFAGSVQGSLIDCMVTPVSSNGGSYSGSSNANLTISATADAAGFVNTLTGVAEKCAALGSVTGSNAAGFVNVNNGSISRCTANTTLSGAKSSGFVSENQKQIENCYAWYFMAAASDGTTPATFGFAAGNSGSITGAYAASVPQGSEAETLFAPSAGSYSGCFGLAAMLSEDIPTAPTGVRHITLEEMADLEITELNSYGWLQPNTNAVYPYNSALVEYPYPMLLEMPQYGDWQGVPDYPFGVAYYEMIGDETYWSYVDLSDPSQTLFGKDVTSSNLLGKEDMTGAVEESGYAVFARRQRQISSIMAGDTPLYLNQLEKMEPYVAADGVQYTVYKIASTVIPTDSQYPCVDASASANPITITVTGNTGASATITPYFANAIQKPEEAAQPFQIRSAQQLQNIRLYPDGDYTIGRNVDLTGFSFQPIAPFSGSITAEGVKISNYTGASGLFGSLTGAALNGVVLENAKVTVSQTTVDAVGVLADSADAASVLTGCQLLSPVLTLDTGAQSSGLVIGQNSASLNSCAVENGTLTIGANASCTAVGGLVGSTTGGSLSGCSVTATTVNANAACTAVGGLVGSTTGGSLSGCSATGTTVNASAACTAVGGLVGSTTGANLSECSVSGNLGVSGTPAETLYVGGFLGQEAKSDAQASSYTDCSAAVEMTVGGAKAGKFVGYVYNGQFTRCSATNANETMQFLAEIYRGDSSAWNPAESGRLFSSTEEIPQEPIDRNEDGTYTGLTEVKDSVPFTPREAFLAALDSCTFVSPKTEEGQTEPSYLTYQQVIGETPEVPRYYSLAESQQIRYSADLADGAEPGRDYLIVYAQPSEDGTTVTNYALTADGNVIGSLAFDPKVPFNQETSSHALWEFARNGNGLSLQNQSGNRMYLGLDTNKNIGLWSDTQSTPWESYYWKFALKENGLFSASYYHYRLLSGESRIGYLSFGESGFTGSSSPASLKLYQVTSKDVCQGTFTRVAQDYSCFSQLAQ